jgi:hypothetical protein
MDNQDRLLAPFADGRGGYAHARLPEPTCPSCPKPAAPKQAGEPAGAIGAAATMAHPFR